MAEKAGKKEWLLMVVSILVTLVLAILVIRWLAPSLLGISRDMVLVQSSKEVPPYFENIFRKEDLKSLEFFMQDPILKSRGRQFLPDLYGIGPHDLLGFRNTHVPNSADIIIIGDSQTYGNNVRIWDNWPHILKSDLPESTSVYSMATGGWGGIQYFYAFAKSLIFSPEIIIVAFYAGNDSLETFSMAYGSEEWENFRIDNSLTKYDIPEVEFPPPKEEQWPVTFSDGITTVFTPKLRHASNQQHPVVDAGYRIMINVAREIVSAASERGIEVVFTIIPTKEYVYYRKIDLENIPKDPAYIDMIRDERNRISDFSRSLSGIGNATYVDVIDALVTAAVQPVVLYPASSNGHPVAAGYRVIADALRVSLAKNASMPEEGFFKTFSRNGIEQINYKRGNKFWVVGSDDHGNLLSNSEYKELQSYSSRKLGNLMYMGYMSADEIESISGE